MRNPMGCHDDAYLDVPVVVDHDVLWLEVAVDNILGMHVLQRKNRLRYVEVAIALDEVVLANDLAQKRASRDVLELQV